MADGFDQDTIVFASIAAACVVCHFMLVAIRTYVNACPCDVHEMYSIDDSVDPILENSDMMTSSEAERISPPNPIGKMKHIEIRDMWLQKEVREGKVEVSKVPGDENPADLMTKILGLKDIQLRLDKMNLAATWISCPDG